MFESPYEGYDLSPFLPLPAVARVTSGWRRGADLYF